MGSDSGDNDEKPVHKVTVGGFSMDKTEVTQAEFERVMGYNPSHFKASSNNPVDSVSWYDAKKFCEKVGKRLPTEAEWEYACRLGSSPADYCGDEKNADRPWIYAKAERKPDRLGLYDMRGNVWEWCGDWYFGDYYANSPSENPKGPDQGYARALRGGSWSVIRNRTRCFCRDGYLPDYRVTNTGFRCAR